MGTVSLAVLERDLPSRMSARRHFAGSWVLATDLWRPLGRDPDFGYGPKGSPSDATPFTFSSRLFDVMMPRTTMVTI